MVDAHALCGKEMLYGFDFPIAIRCFSEADAYRVALEYNSSLLLLYVYKAIYANREANNGKFTFFDILPIVIDGRLLFDIEQKYYGRKQRVTDVRSWLKDKENPKSWYEYKFGDMYGTFGGNFYDSCEGILNG